MDSKKLLFTFFLATGACAKASPSRTSANQVSLPRPFTTLQLRGAFVVGSQLSLRVSAFDKSTVHYWKVLEADVEGLSLERLMPEPGEDPNNHARTQRLTWVELLELCTFAEDLRGSRVRASRDTVLGELDGWYYELDSIGEAPARQLFFGDAYPGPPLWARASVGGTTLLVEVIARSNPK